MYGVRPLPIHNTFSIVPADANKRADGPLRLYWFSQTLGAGRGLEDVIRAAGRSEEHTSELQSLTNLVCRLLLEKKKKKKETTNKHRKKKKIENRTTKHKTIKQTRRVKTIYKLPEGMKSSTT